MASNSSCIDINDYKCNSALLLPMLNEYTWNPGVRAFLYLLGLLWCFFGVAIIADVFMCAIEKITSKTATIKVANPDEPEGYEEVEVKVWNNTVANLTLMALGSSAPEILLSCIEIIGKGFKSGDLGPSTIVGSAAFNLLVITAVCVMSIPYPDTRRIKAIKVFSVTAVCSIFAYIWLIIVLVLVSPDYVEVWEAVLTFIFFPIMVIVAYLADKDYCSKKQVDDEAEVELGFDEKSSLKIVPENYMNPKEMREFIKELGKNPDLTEEDVARLAASKVAESQCHDRLWYRINATRHITGSQKLTPTLPDNLKQLYHTVRQRQLHLVDDEVDSFADFSDGGNKSVLEFTATQASVLERDQRVRVGIRRYGKINTRVLFRFETIDGTAESDKDYIPVKTTMVFEPEETYKYVDLDIIDDNEWEPDEIFFCRISVEPKQNAIIGKKAICEVTIINDDEPGTFEFAKPSFLFKESAGKAMIPVERVNGADGRVTVGWKTKDMSATSGSDFEGGEGTITFEHGETTKMLEIAIYDDQEPEKDECFAVILLDASGGAKLGRVKKTIVTIVNDDEFNGMVSRLVDLTNMNVDGLRVDTNTWADQFRNAMNVNGGDVECASAGDYVMHFLTFGWKVIFALVPPPSIWGGWMSFIIALLMIGMLTAIVGDLATIFGCLVGLKDSVTAITFVALGTSLPDLFASKQAATQEKTADNSIGNVTGSNSVNVFLGLGLPWLIASIYWTSKGTTFYVKAGSLGFSVLIYTITAIICVGLLVLRRFVPVFGRAELGGPKGSKIACGVFLIFLWIFYVLISSLQAYDHIKVNF